MFLWKASYIDGTNMLKWYNLIFVVAWFSPQLILGNYISYVFFLYESLISSITSLWHRNPWDDLVLTKKQQFTLEKMIGSPYNP